MRLMTLPAQETPAPTATTTKSQMQSNFTRSLRNNGAKDKLIRSRIKMDQEGLIAKASPIKTICDLP